MSNLFFDNFGSGTGGSLSLNPNWEVLAGVSYPFSEYAGEVRPQNGTFQFSSVGSACKYIPPSADYQLSADWIIRSFLSETFPSMRGRIVDANNYYSLGINTTTRVVSLSAKVSGSDTTLGTLTLPPEAAGTTVHFKLIMDGNQISAVVGGTTLGPYTHSTLTAIGKTGLKEYVGTAGSDTTGIGITNYSIDTIDAGSPDATAPGATLTGTASLTPGSASGGSAPVDATADGATLTGTASLTPGTATGGASGTFVSDILINNTDSVMASVSVIWEWRKGTGIGVAPTSVTYGAGTTSATGTLTASGLPVGAGELLIATADYVNVCYQRGTVT